MSDYYSDLDRIKKAGHQHALDQMSNGTTEPVEGLFSGEWADGLTGQDAIDYAGIKECSFRDLEDYEQTDVMDAFEDGYNSAPWPVPTYTVRSIWEGEQLLEVTGLDFEDARRRYEEEERYYLNLPNSEDAAGTTLQMFRESDGHVERELTFA